MEGQVEGQTSGRSLFVVHDHGQVVAAASASVEGSQMTIHELATDKLRQRQGIGRKLIAGIASDAAEAGIEAIWLRADAPAVPFYEGVGFAQESSERWYIMQARVKELQQGQPERQHVQAERM